MEDLEGAMDIPNQVSIRTVGIDEIVHAIKYRVERWRDGMSTRKKVLDRKVEGAGTLHPLYATAESIVGLTGGINTSGNMNLGRDSVFYDIKELYRLSGFRERTLARAMDQQKRPSIRRKIIHRDVLRILKLLHKGSISLDVTRVAPNTFCIRRNDR